VRTDALHFIKEIDEARKVRLVLEVFKRVVRFIQFRLRNVRIGFHGLDVCADLRILLLQFSDTIYDVAHVENVIPDNDIILYGDSVSLEDVRDGDGLRVGDLFLDIRQLEVAYLLLTGVDGT